MDSSRISPTAHYTGFVWTLHGLSYPAFRTQNGALLYEVLRPFNALHEVLTGGPSLRQMLVQRHRVLDDVLAQAIEQGYVGQVVEVAAGLSPRGARFCERFAERDLTYIEADLPEMAALKRSLLEKIPNRSARHHVVSLDALLDEGPESLAGVAGEYLDPMKGTAIVTEGLLNYFSAEHVAGMWGRFARVLGAFPRGVYVSDLHTEAEASGSLVPEAFRWVLSAFARGKVHIHFRDAEEARGVLKEAGFVEASLHAPHAFAHRLEIPAVDGPTRVRIVEAWVS